MSTPIEQAYGLVSDAKQEVNELLKGTEHVGNLLYLNGLFDRILTRLKFSGGVSEPAKQTQKVTFPPITNFMGEEIKGPETLKAADLNPDDAAKREYLAKVERLYGEIGQISAETIVNSYTIPGDISVLRGVAKKAGVAGYKDAAITVDFVKSIVNAITKRTDAAKKQKEINDSSKKPVRKVLTKDDIDTDKRLQEIGAKVGDTSVTAEDGTVTIEVKTEKNK